MSEKHWIMDDEDKFKLLDSIVEKLINGAMATCKPYLQTWVGYDIKIIGAIQTYPIN